MSSNDIAIIGMAGRFPGAATLADFWTNVRDGVESIPSDDVRLRLISPLRPAVMQDDEAGFTYLIMPIRLAG